MLKTRISMLDAAYFLIDKYGYERVNVVNQNMDLWLLNRSSKKYPMIRLTPQALSEGSLKKEAYMKQAANIGSLLNVNTKILNIHFNVEQANEVNSGPYQQALVSQTYISPFLNEEFNGFGQSFRPVGDDLEAEIKKREIKFLDLASKKKNRKRFKLSMIGPSHILMLLNALVYMLTPFIIINYGRSLTALILGALYKNFVYGANQWWRLISAGFLHVDFFHFLINMIVLLQIGMVIEKIYGKKQMLIIYMVSVVSSSLLSLVMMDGGSISLGASGGIFGLLGAFLVYLFSSNLYKIPKVRSQITRTLLANLLISLLPGISFWGHLGGLIGGILISIAVSEAKSLKPAKIHAYISTFLVIALTFGYAVFMDNNVYNIKPEVDKLSIQAYKEIGLEDFANNLDKDLKIYYESIGESYE